MTADRWTQALDEAMVAADEVQTLLAGADPNDKGRWDTLTWLDSMHSDRCERIRSVLFRRYSVEV